MSRIVIVLMSCLFVCSCGQERAKFVDFGSRPEIKYEQVPEWVKEVHPGCANGAALLGGCDSEWRNVVGAQAPLMSEFAPGFPYFRGYPKAMSVCCKDGSGPSLTIDLESRKILSKIDGGGLTYYTPRELEARWRPELCGGKVVGVEPGQARYEFPCPPKK